MDKPLTVWYCDNCGERIESVNKGYVIWRSVTKPADFRIIHQGKCDIKAFHASMALENFLGPDGLAMLTAMLSVGPLKRTQGDVGRIAPEDIDAFVDFMRRVQTPYYEEARRLFENPDLQEWFSDHNELSPYMPKTLKGMIEEYGQD